jgi:hypothetical protein
MERLEHVASEGGLSSAQAEPRLTLKAEKKSCFVQSLFLYCFFKTNKYKAHFTKLRVEAT